MKTYTKDFKRYPWAYRRALGFLGRLHPYCGFPKVVSTEPESLRFTLNWCGECIEGVLNAGRVDLLTVRGQLRALLSILRRENIRHRDITKFNLLWHEERGLHVVDFGWATDLDEDNSALPVPPIFRAWMVDRTDEEMAVVTLWQLEHEGITLPAEELIRFAEAKL